MLLHLQQVCLDPFEAVLASSTPPRCRSTGLSPSPCMSDMPHLCLLGRSEVDMLLVQSIAGPRPDLVIAGAGSRMRRAHPSRRGPIAAALRPLRWYARHPAFTARFHLKQHWGSATLFPGVTISDKAVHSVRVAVRDDADSILLASANRSQRSLPLHDRLLPDACAHRCSLSVQTRQCGSRSSARPGRPRRTPLSPPASVTPCACSWAPRLVGRKARAVPPR